MSKRVWKYGALRSSLNYPQRMLWLCRVGIFEETQ